eukprot:SAG22_NODE_90_length_21067_cov_8.490843_6_plen_242_part_00
MYPQDFDGGNPLANSSDSSSSEEEPEEEPEEKEEESSGKKKKKGTGAAAASLLDDIMGGIDMSQMVIEEPEPEPEKVEVVRTRDPNRLRKDPKAMMRALKEKQNAKNAGDAAAKAMEAAAGKVVDVTDAGHYGKTVSTKQAAVTEFLRGKRETEEMMAAPPAKDENGVPVFDYQTAKQVGTFTAEQLMGSKSSLPKGVNPRKRETYLTDEEFQRVLHMAPASFAGLPKWKRDKLKKSLDIL